MTWLESITAKEAPPVETDEVALVLSQWGALAIARLVIEQGGPSGVADLPGVRQALAAHAEDLTPEQSGA
jgi:hypothetical protein